MTNPALPPSLGESPRLVLVYARAWRGLSSAPILFGLAALVIFVATDLCQPGYRDGRIRLGELWNWPVSSATVERLHLGSAEYDVEAQWMPGIESSFSRRTVFILWISHLLLVTAPLWIAAVVLAQRSTTPSALRRSDGSGSIRGLYLHCVLGGRSWFRRCSWACSAWSFPASSSLPDSRFSPSCWPTAGARPGVPSGRAGA